MSLHGTQKLLQLDHRLCLIFIIIAFMAFKFYNHRLASLSYARSAGGLSMRLQIKARYAPYFSIDRLSFVLFKMSYRTIFVVLACKSLYLYIQISNIKQN